MLIRQLFFIASSAYIVYLMKIKFRPTLDPAIDTLRLEYLVGPCAVLALIFNYRFDFLEVMWAFSIYLEAVAILPQLFILQRTGEAETITTQCVGAGGDGADRSATSPRWPRIALCVRLLRAESLLTTRSAELAVEVRGRRHLARRAHAADTSRKTRSTRSQSLPGWYRRACGLRATELTRQWPLRPFSIRPPPLTRSAGLHLRVLEQSHARAEGALLAGSPAPDRVFEISTDHRSSSCRREPVVVDPREHAARSRGQRRSSGPICCSSTYAAERT